MSSRPDIELALDVRSYEQIIVLSNPESVYDYPENWVRPQKGSDLSLIDPNSVVIVDRVEIARRTLALIGERCPRLVAFAPLGLEQEKSMRRMLTALYPWWSETWTLFTSFGKVLVTRDVMGRAYDRDELVDMRPPLGAA